MAAISFSDLPAEIHASIAEQCEKNDIINLCLTSTLLKNRCLHVLYCHVDLQLDRDDPRTESFRKLDTRRKQQQFVNALLSYPEYGKHVRFFKTGQYLPFLFDHSEEEFWRALLSLSHVQRVEVIFESVLGNCIMGPAEHFPNNLFQTATSVKLVGENVHNLAVSILNAINPATLKHLWLDRVDNYKIEQPQGGDGQTKGLDAKPGLLTKLTGRCTALRTLTWRKAPNYLRFHEKDVRYPAVEEASFIEWAAFIRSVRGTVENFTIELDTRLGRGLRIATSERLLRVADESFRRLILPAIISGSWPCLTSMAIRGVRDLNGQEGKVTMAMELRAALGGNTKIVMEP